MPDLGGRADTYLVRRQIEPQMALTVKENRLVGHVSRRWEPKPLRWLGVHSLYAAYRQADRIAETRQPERCALVARIDDRLPGR